MNRFRDIEQLRNRDGKRYYINTILPEIALSQDKLRKDSYHVALGEQIRIPVNPLQYVSDFTKFNNDR